MPPAARAQSSKPPRSLRVFLAGQGCPNCERFVETLRSIPCLHPVTTVVDVQKTPTENVRSVPTIVVDDSTVLSGSRAFEFLRQFDAVLADPPGACSLEFSTIGGECGELDGSWFSRY